MIRVSARQEEGHEVCDILCSEAKLVGGQHERVTELEGLTSSRAELDQLRATNADIEQARLAAVAELESVNAAAQTQRMQALDEIVSLKEEIATMTEELTSAPSAFRRRKPFGKPHLSWPQSADGMTPEHSRKSTP